MHQTINKAIESKLKQSHIKGYIDLSNIGLDSLPDEIFKLNYHSADGIKWWTNVDFTKIDLSYNNLSEKNSYDFRNIPHARVLYLISNKFNSIPLYLYYLKDLVFLDMSNNRLTHIEDNFFWNLFRNLNEINYWKTITQNHPIKMLIQLTFINIIYLLHSVIITNFALSKVNKILLTN